MAPHTVKTSLALKSALVGLAVLIGSGQANAHKDEKLCASYHDKQILRNYYFGYGGHPTDPMAIPSHVFRLVESKVSSSFSKNMAVGTVATPARFKEIWQSIDTWGEDNTLSVVITVDGWHAFAFPMKVPVTRKEEHAAGFYDVFGENGDGVRGHINPDLLGLAYAVRLPKGDGTFQRSISFYSKEGDLVVGLYATEGGKVQNPALIEGFDRTWDLIASMPRACDE